MAATTTAEWIEPADSVKVPPVSAGRPVCAGGTERGRALREDGSSKHWNERSE